MKICGQHNTSMKRGMVEVDMYMYLTDVFDSAMLIINQWTKQSTTDDYQTHL